MWRVSVILNGISVDATTFSTFKEAWDYSRLFPSLDDPTYDMWRYRPKKEVEDEFGDDGRISVRVSWTDEIEVWISTRRDYSQSLPFAISQY